MRAKPSRKIASLVSCLSMVSASDRSHAQTSESPDSGVIIISTLSAAELADACKFQKATNLDTCGAYTLGIADRLALDRRICPSLNAFAGQSIAVAKRELLEKPELWGNPPVWIISEALVRAFPCPR